MVFITILTNVFFLASDENVKFLLSVASVLTLVFPLLWGILGIIEFNALLESYTKFKYKQSQDKTEKQIYINVIKKIRISLTVNVSYLVVLLLQLLYVITNWELINI